MGRVFFDVETKKSFQETGGKKEDLVVSCAAAFSEEENRFIHFRDNQVQELIENLFSASLVIGFNILGFDYYVLKPYTEKDLFSLPTLDLMRELQKELGFRLSLDHLALENLGKGKKGSGLDAIKWYREGKIDKLLEYCEYDVEITKELYELGKKQGFLYYRDKIKGEKKKVKCLW
ncbi:MAG: ribonuclease H-like domain-containing protein [bacterium]|nr:ribonuclease H-like domain-containing protein [bacterium]